MSKKHKQTVAKIISFSVVAIICSLVLKSNKYPNTIAISAGIGIAIITLVVSEHQNGIE